VRSRGHQEACCGGRCSRIANKGAFLSSSVAPGGGSVCWPPRVVQDYLWCQAAWLLLTWSSMHECCGCICEQEVLAPLSCSECHHCSKWPKARLCLESGRISENPVQLGLDC
jgi:hypothetical protein